MTFLIKKIDLNWAILMKQPSVHNWVLLIFMQRACWSVLYDACCGCGKKYTQEGCHGDVVYRRAYISSGQVFSSYITLCMDTMYCKHVSFVLLCCFGSSNSQHSSTYGLGEQQDLSYQWEPQCQIHLNFYVSSL